MKILYIKVSQLYLEEVDRDLRTVVLLLCRNNDVVFRELLRIHNLSVFAASRLPRLPSFILVALATRVNV